MCEGDDPYEGLDVSNLPRYRWVTPRVDRKSPAYSRITKAGFIIHEIVDGHALPNGRCVTDWISVGFTCSCGRHEILKASGCDAVNGVIDVARILEEGTHSVSVKHLRDDGFTVEQIRTIRRAYI